MTQDKELAALGRELGRALFVWYNARGQYPSGPACDQALYEVVGRTFMPFYVKHAVPVEEERPWCEIPARWEVQAPDGKWYRIISTVQRDGQQYVYLDMGNGEGREWPRNPADKVTCRPPAAPDETDKALAALGRVEIIEDQVS